jgi:hypothetical protein
MRALIFGVVLCPTLFMAVPASAITKQQAAAQCRAIHANASGMRVAERTGVTVQQQVKRCIQGKMKGKK